MARINTFGGTGGSQLTITVTEDCTINKRDYGGKQIFIIGNIKDISKRIYTVTTTESNLLTFSTTTAAGQFIKADVRYIRISNLDDTNHAVLTFKDENDGEHAIKLDRGMTWLYQGDSLGGLANVIDANQAELQFTDSTVDTSSGAYTATCVASKLIKVGQGISGTGIQAGSTVATVNTPGAVTSFTMSKTASSTETNTTATFTTIMLDLESITAQADTSSVDLEIYVASK